MILRGIEISGFGCYRNPVKVDAMSPGLNIVYGPNETGKSTLMRAVAHALFDNHSTRGQSVEAMRPWGTALSPRIVLEFEVGGKRYQLEKRFLDGNGSFLREWIEGRYQALAETKTADEQVRQFLQAEAAKKGLADMGNWGLAQLLWLPQERVRFEPPGSHERVRQHLTSVIGGNALSEPEQTLLDRLERSYAEYFTGTGREKKHSLSQQAREALEAAEKDVKELQAEMRRLADVQKSTAALQHRVEEGTREEEVLKADCQALEDAAKKEAGTEKKLTDANAEVNVRGEAYQRWQERLTARDKLLERINTHTAQIRELQAEITQATPEKEAAQTAFEQAQDTLNKQREAAAKVEKELADARKMDRLFRLQNEVEQLENRYAKARQCEQALAEQRRKLDERPFPTESQYRTAADKDGQVHVLQARLDSLGLEMRLVPEQAITIRWETAGGTEEHLLRVGEELPLHAGRAGVLHIPGFGRITVRSGANEPAQVEEQLHAAREERDTLLARFKVADVAALWQLYEEGRVLQHDMADEQRALARHCDGFLDITALATRKADLTRERDTLAAELGISHEGLAARETPDLSAMERHWQERRIEARKAEERVKERERALDAARQRKERAEIKLENIQPQQARDQEALTQQEQTQGSREHLQNQVETVLRAKMEAESKRELLEKELSPESERAATRLEQRRAQLQHLQAALKKDWAAWNQSEGELGGLTKQGLYSRLAEAEERRAEAQREYALEASRAVAVNHLYHLALDRKDRMTRSIVAPVQHRVSDILSKIRDLPSVLSLDDAFTRIELTIKDEQEVSLERLSWGTREQVLLALRLALGEVLSGGESAVRQMVVLDDPLVNSDRARMARALSFIQEASEKMQIVIFTAFPEHYQSLSGHPIDLTLAKQGEAVSF